VLGGRILRVADEAVGPEVGDVHFDGVAAGVEESVDAGGPGLLPESDGGLAVDADGGYFVNLSEGEINLTCGGCELRGGELEGRAVGGSAGEVADAGVGGFRP